MKLAGVFLNLIYYDLLAAYRNGGDWLNPLLFSVLVVSLFPLAITHDAALLHSIAPGLVWLAALLAMLISFNHLFRPDFEEGSLHLLLLNNHPLSILLLAKVIAHWFKTALPLIIISPILAILLHLNFYETEVLVATLLLGTPILSFIGAISMALTISLRNNGMLLALLILPLCVPVLIFGANAVSAAGLGQEVRAQFALLGAFFLLSLSLAPLVMAAALRIGIE